MIITLQPYLHGCTPKLFLSSSWRSTGLWIVVWFVFFNKSRSNFSHSSSALVNFVVFIYHKVVNQIKCKLWQKGSSGLWLSVWNLYISLWTKKLSGVMHPWSSNTSLKPLARLNCFLTCSICYLNRPVLGWHTLKPPFPALPEPNWLVFRFRSDHINLPCQGAPSSLLLVPRGSSRAGWSGGELSAQPSCCSLGSPPISCALWSGGFAAHRGAQGQCFLPAPRPQRAGGSGVTNREVWKRWEIWRQRHGPGPEPVVCHYCSSSSCSWEDQVGSAIPCSGAVEAVEATAERLLMIKCVLKTREKERKDPWRVTLETGVGRVPREGTSSRVCCTRLPRSVQCLLCGTQKTRAELKCSQTILCWKG